MVQETTLMKVFLILSTIISFAFASTLAQVQADVSSILTSATTFDKDIVALPASMPSLSSVLQVHTDAETLMTSLDQMTADLKSLPLPVDEDDVISLLDDITSYVPLITDALSEIIPKKAAFNSALGVIGFSSLILKDLIGLNSSNSNLETTILTTFPGLNCHTTAVDAAFTNAIAAFTD